MIIYANRASTIIYNYLLSNYGDSGYWLIPINSCPVVPLTFFTAGVPFKLVDIETSTYCMNSEYILKSLRDPDCKGMVYIYSYGVNISAGNLFQQVKTTRKDFKIIEDKCLNPPSFSTQNRSSYADLTLYSTGYVKYVDLGFGGFGICNREITYKKHQTYYNPSYLTQIESDYKRCLQENELIDQPDPSWLDDRPLQIDNIAKYKSIVRDTRRDVTLFKRELNAIYKKHIPSNYWLTLNGSPVSSWRFNLRLPFNKEKLIGEIFARGLFASSHYQPVDKIFDVEVIGGEQAAYSLYDKVLNLFNDKYFSAKVAKDISDVIKHFNPYMIKP